jgi:hypothetical protein
MKPALGSDAESLPTFSPSRLSFLRVGERFLKRLKS